MDLVNGVDFHPVLLTVVAVGHFSDKQMARTETGRFDNNFHDLEWGKIPSITIYPDKDDKEPSFYTVRFGEGSTFIDVDIMDDLWGAMYIFRSTWNIEDYN